MNASQHPDVLALKAAVEQHCIFKGDFTLASGLKSPYYFDCKLGMLHGPTLLQIVKQMESIIYLNLPDLPEAVGGVTIGGSLLVGAMLIYNASHRVDIPKNYIKYGTVVRDKPKDHGTKSLVTNTLPEGTNIVILEDVITTGGSVIRALDVFKELKYNTLGVVVLIDRQQGGVETIRDTYNVPVISIFKKDEFDLS
ncbi:MAG: orotate phosphoribosyltransferase [Nitrosopumilaceae archaeon]